MFSSYLPAYKIMLLSILYSGQENEHAGLGEKPWNIIKDTIFLKLFEKLQAGCFNAVPVSDDLKRVCSCFGR